MQTDFAATQTERPNATQGWEYVGGCRGLFQKPRHNFEGDLMLALVTKRIPKGIIAMVSALAYHGLSDQMPRKTWVAIGNSDWSPVPSYPTVRIMRFADKYLHQGNDKQMVSAI